MKVTREMIDNDKKILHINYTKKDIKDTLKRIKELELLRKKEEEEKKKNNNQNPLELSED